METRKKKSVKERNDEQSEERSNGWHNCLKGGITWEVNFVQGADVKKTRITCITDFVKIA
jgi:hypothetical protein